MIEPVVNEPNEIVKSNKYIKFIQVVILIIMIYLFVKCLNIHGFLVEFLNNQVGSEVVNFGLQYINILMFIATVGIIIFSIVFFFLMRKKHKEKIYVAIFIYYLILFIFFLIGFRILSQLHLVFYSDSLLEFIKNFTLVFSLIQIPIMLFYVLNILEINFRESKNTEAVTNDKEEIVKKGVRKSFREWKYYFLENKLILVIIIVLVVLVTSTIIFINSDNMFKSYRENKSIEYAGINFKVTESFLTHIGYDGKEINKDKKYIVVKVLFEKRASKKANDFVLVNGVTNYYSNSGINEFVDLAESYKGSANKNEERIFIYEISNDVKLHKPKFRIYDNNEYKEVRLKLQDDSTIQTVGEYNIGEGVSLEGENFTDSVFLVDKYEIKDSFSENYRYCVNNKCYSGISHINPMEVYTDEKTVLKLETSLEENDDYVFDVFNNEEKFLTAFASINIDNKNYSITNITPDTFSSKNVYFLVNNSIKNKENVDLVLTIRDKRYIINLN